MNPTKQMFVTKIESIQGSHYFIRCDDPIILDKSKSWGEGNLQSHPNGCFLRVNAPVNGVSSVSHCVAFNHYKTEPKGWYHLRDRKYLKRAIWITGRILLPSPINTSPTIIQLDTADGPMTYKITEPSMLVCNQITHDIDRCYGEPDIDDCWIDTVSSIKKKYEWLSL